MSYYNEQHPDCKEGATAADERCDDDDCTNHYDDNEHEFHELAQVYVPEVDELEQLENLRLLLHLRVDVPADNDDADTQQLKSHSDSRKLVRGRVGGRLQTGEGGEGVKGCVFRTQTIERASACIY